MTGKVSTDEEKDFLNLGDLSRICPAGKSKTVMNPRLEAPFATRNSVVGWRREK